MDRRDLLKTVALLSGGLATSPLASAIAAAFEGQPPTASNLSLADDEIELVGILAEHIIPATDSPGALAAGVPAFIALLVQDYLPAEEAASYRAGLDAFDRQVRETRGGDFKSLAPDDQLTLLEALDRQAFSGQATGFSPELEHFWRTQKALTVAGYFTSEVGATLALPPAYMGPFEADIPYPSPGSAPH